MAYFVVKHRDNFTFYMYLLTFLIEEGWNVSTLALRVVKGDGKEVGCLGV
jgi:hypothetical protein